MVVKMRAVFLGIFLVFFPLLTFSNEECTSNSNPLIAFHCSKEKGQVSLAKKNLELLKKVTGVEVHDFIDFKKIQLLSNIKSFEDSIGNFKIKYPESKLIRKIEIMRAELLLRESLIPEFDNHLEWIRKKYELSTKEKITTDYLEALSFYRKSKYKESFRLIKQISIKSPLFRSREINKMMAKFQNNNKYILSKKEKEDRLNKLFSDNLYSSFMNEYESNLSTQILIKKALIKIKSKEEKSGLEILKKISNGRLVKSGSQSKDLEAIAEAKYRIILHELRTSSDNSSIARRLNSILKNYPNFTKSSEAGYLSARLFTIDKNYDEAIKVYNWLIKTKSNNYIDKSYYGLGFSSYMKKEYKEALGYFAPLKKSSKSYYRDLGGYWIAICIEKLGDKSLSLKELAKLTPENKVGYYSYLASLKLNKPKLKKDYRKKSISSKTHTAEIELLKLSRESKVLRREVENYTRNKITSLNYKSYLEELNAAEEFNLSIKISYSYRSDNNHKYPRGFKTIVNKYSKKYGVDRNLIFALIREESLFNPEALSYVGAKGLMQLMDRTAKTLDKELKIKSSLYVPDDNINLGTYYLMKLMKRFNNNIPSVLAAYNGGPTNVELWRKKFDGLENDEFVENIPFKETHGYVKRVLRSYYYYKNNI